MLVQPNPISTPGCSTSGVCTVWMILLDAKFLGDVEKFVANENRGDGCLHHIGLRTTNLSTGCELWCFRLQVGTDSYGCAHKPRHIALTAASCDSLQACGRADAVDCKTHAPGGDATCCQKPQSCTWYTCDPFPAALHVLKYLNTVKYQRLTKGVFAIVPGLILLSWEFILIRAGRRVQPTANLITEARRISMATLLHGSPINNLLWPNPLLKLRMLQYQTPARTDWASIISSTTLYKSTSPWRYTWTIKVLWLWPTIW